MAELTRRQLIQAGIAVSIGSALPAETVKAAAKAHSAGENTAVTVTKPPVPAARERIKMSSGWKFALGNACDLDKDFGYGKLERERTFGNGYAGFATHDDHTLRNHLSSLLIYCSRIFLANRRTRVASWIGYGCLTNLLPRDPVGRSLPSLRSSFGLHING